MNTFPTVDTSYGFCINVLRTRCYWLSFHRPIIALSKYANSFAIVCLRVEITEKGDFLADKEAWSAESQTIPRFTLYFALCRMILMWTMQPNSLWLDIESAWPKSLVGRLDH